jgi:hypothetical protein
MGASVRLRQDRNIVGGGESSIAPKLLIHKIMVAVGEATIEHSGPDDCFPVGAGAGGGGGAGQAEGRFRRGRMNLGHASKAVAERRVIELPRPPDDTLCQGPGQKIITKTTSHT